MPFHQSGPLRFYTFGLLDGVGVQHAVFTRQGGVSQEPWASLNLGGTVGDEPAHVIENRERAFQSIGRDPTTLFDVWQVHGTEVVCTEKPRPPHTPHQQGDAILTDCPGVTLLMRFADCVPILLYDPRHCIVGLVHSGWPGTVKRVAKVAVEAMHNRYHSDPGEILAGIGPSIGAHHYPVGPEVVAQVRQSFRADAEALLLVQDHAVQFDLWSANRLTLQESGVRHIEMAEICTACHLDEWYSHRGENGRTGRFGVMIGLK